MSSQSTRWNSLATSCLLPKASSKAALASPALSYQTVASGVFDRLLLPPPTVFPCIRRRLALPSGDGSCAGRGLMYLINRSQKPFDSI